MGVFVHLFWFCKLNLRLQDYQQGDSPKCTGFAHGFCKSIVFLLLHVLGILIVLVWLYHNNILTYTEPAVYCMLP